MRNEDRDYLPSTSETLYDLAYDIFSFLSMGAFLITCLFWGPQFLHWLNG